MLKLVCGVEVVHLVAFRSAKRRPFAERKATKRGAQSDKEGAFAERKPTMRATCTSNHWVIRSAAVILAVVAAPASAQEAKQLDAFQRKVLPLLDRYCVACHQEGAAEGGIAFDSLEDQEDAIAAKRTWLRVLDALEENDDVQNVYANFDIPDEVLEAVEA